MKFLRLIPIAVGAVILLSNSNAQHYSKTLASKIDRFAPSKMSANTSRLSPGDKKALAKLVEACKLVDSIYLRQAWSGNPDLIRKLQNDKSANGQQKLHYFKINMGPWSNLDQDEPFIEGVPKQKPLGANYYPEGMNKDEINRWITSLPDEGPKNQFTGYFYVVKSDKDMHLFAVPYSDEYKDQLQPLSKLLKEAASLTDNMTLREFLNKRADAFLTNDYYESDLAWMNLDSPIEPTIGPYEVYMDELFNYKAAFEAFITLRNHAETQKLAKFSSYLQEIEDNLPIDPKYRNPKLGGLSPIRVVDEVAIGGEARAGVQTAAFNLPNDERFIREKGSKRIMLKNVQEAKFNKILVPISTRVVGKSQRSLIAFDPFFTHILTHELMHGLGPHSITVDGKETTVAKEMSELGSALEEAKADISGLFALQFLIDKGVVAKSMEQKLYATYLAGVFRSVRFGTNDAHGKGMALQFNYLTNEGAFKYDEPSGTYSVVFDKIKPAVAKLTREIMTIQAEGSYDKAKELLGRWGIVELQMQKTLDQLGHVPVDIEPIFPHKP